MAAFALKINGQTRQVDVDPNTPLLWAIRDGAGLMGTKYGCGVAQCGACTVMAQPSSVLAALWIAARIRT
jgi:isoquinoline 1-oxidoreductase alpha subunit